jgi:hypothetical protein
MKHHVLLGLILGLLATAKLGAQAAGLQTTPVLFNVTFDNSSLEVTIRATGENALTPTGIPDNLNNSLVGMTFINFFSSEVEGTAGEIVGERTLAIKVGDSEYSPIDPYQIFSNDPGIQQPGTNLVALNTTRYNPGQNLAIGSFAELPWSGGTITFLADSTLTFKYTAQRTITNNSEPTGVNATFDGPLYIYAGYNNAYNGNSFLGTYTLTVVPEPSTYAAIAGGLGLAAAVLHRRRRRSRASAA